MLVPSSLELPLGSWVPFIPAAAKVFRVPGQEPDSCRSGLLVGDYAFTFGVSCKPVENMMELKVHGSEETTFMTGMPNWVVTVTPRAEGEVVLAFNLQRFSLIYVFQV